MPNVVSRWHFLTVYLEFGKTLTLLWPIFMPLNIYVDVQPLKKNLCSHLVTLAAVTTKGFKVINGAFLNTK